MEEKRHLDTIINGSTTTENGVDAEIYRLAQSLMQDSVIIISADSGTIIDITEPLLNATGYTRQELIGAPITQIDLSASAETYCEINPDDCLQREAEFQCKDGAIYDVELSARRVQYRGQPAIVCVNRDITKRKILEMRLAYERGVLDQLTTFLQEFIDGNHNTGKMMQSVIRNALEWSSGTAAAIFLIEDNRLVCKASKGSELLTLGRSLDIHSSLLGQCLQTNTIACCQDQPCKLLPRTRCNDCLGFASMLAVPLHYGQKPVGVVCIVADKPNYFIQYDTKRMRGIASFIAAAFYQTEQNRQYKALLKQKSKVVKELERANNTLADLATIDSLTGIKNRRAFSVFLDNEIKRSCRYDTNLSLIMLDIDHFKKYNDDYGHQCGDYVLKKVANILETNIRSIDCAARYGGEEFAIVLPNTDLAGAYSAADHCRKEIESADWGERRPVTASFGIAVFNISIDTTEELIAAADKALYRAKKLGRNRVITFENIKE